MYLALGGKLGLFVASLYQGCFVLGQGVACGGEFGFFLGELVELRLAFGGDMGLFCQGCGLFAQLRLQL